MGHSDGRQGDCGSLHPPSPQKDEVLQALLGGLEENVRLNEVV